MADLPYLSIESGVFVDSVRLKHRGARWQVLWHWHGVDLPLELGTVVVDVLDDDVDSAGTGQRRSSCNTESVVKQSHNDHNFLCLCSSKCSFFFTISETGQSEVAGRAGAGSACIIYYKSSSYPERGSPSLKWELKFDLHLQRILLLFIEMRYNLDQRWQVPHIYKEVIDSRVVWASKVVSRAVVRMMIQRSGCVLYATCVLHPAQFWSRRWCLKKKGNWFYHYVKGSKVLLAVPKNPIWKISLLFWTIFRRFVSQYVLTHWRKRLESNW